MHLLNTSTITLFDVNDDKPPAYAILSHRWGESEVVFQDMKDGTGLSKAGYAKIAGCCAQAAEDGWQFVWIDSCCIDKSSSAELSEAINSMFRWYRDAQVCYAYLGDVPSTRDSPYNKNSAFRRSKWFTRGWTLQELLAPETIVFFNQTWFEIGTKSSLAPLISVITGIEHLFSFKKACVAQKMSWAAKRETTRIEDRAYCLMGLFDVNMPLLYGEGDKAFTRLQLEILSSVDDESIFAWAEYLGPEKDQLIPSIKSWNLKLSGLLASSPSAFEFSRDVQRVAFDGARPPFSMTNKGLRIEPLLVESKLLSSIFVTEDGWPDSDDDLYAMQLNCGRMGRSGYLSIYLRQSGPQFLRAAPSKLIMFEMRRDPHITATHNAAFQRRIVFVKQQSQFIDIGRTFPTVVEFRLLIRTRSLLTQGISLSQRFIHGSPVNNYWEKDTAEGSLLVLHSGNFFPGSAEVHFSGSGYDVFGLVLRCLDSRALIDLLVPKKNQSSRDIAAQLFLNQFPKSPVDRISKSLQSGKAVSVSLKRTEDSPEMKRYLIDVTIDPEGYLRWPEQGILS